jgi:hypothetical protein
MIGLRDDLAPRAGDLLLARVEALGHHTRLHLPNGRRQQLFVGDDVIVAYGDRYAPSQFEALVPRRLEECHLVAGGGIAARMVTKHQRIRRGPTRIRPLGLVTGEPDGPPLNVAQWALPEPRPPQSGAVPTLAVVGTAMDSGKTTAAAFLARGVRRCGLRVGYAKLTGTGAACDTGLLSDAGADPVLDFTDAGCVSTYRVGLEKIEAIARDLIGHLQASGVDAILLEVADGILQAETAALLASQSLRSLIDGTIVASCDAMGAVSAVGWLEANGHRVAGLAGVIDSSPLQAREAQAATRHAVYSRNDLCDPSTAAKLLDLPLGLQS